LGVVEEFVAFMEKNLTVKRHLLLCGGMVNCPGLIERMQQDLKKYEVNVEADEHFIWKSAHDIVNKM
jgi:hypothetical protein